MIQTFPLRTSFPIGVRERLSRLMKMAFPTIYQPGQGVYDLNQTLDFKMSRNLGGTHWWLAPSGGVDNIPPENCIEAHDAKNAESLIASYDNLASPLNGLPDGSHDLTVGVLPTWDNINGWGILQTGYLISDVKASPNGGGNILSAIIRFSGITNATDNYLFGVWSPGFSIWPWDSGTGYDTFYNGGVKAFAASKTTAGIMAISQNNFYINGLLMGSRTYTSPTNKVFYIGKMNGYAKISRGYIQAIAFYDIPIDDYMTDLNTAMAAL